MSVFLLAVVCSRSCRLARAGADGNESSGEHQRDPVHAGAAADAAEVVLGGEHARHVRLGPQAGPPSAGRNPAVPPRHVEGRLGRRHPQPRQL